jgi:flavin reductase (DIM6/NTAB) family NADH-FMN oxidoreductase RutF
VLQIVEITPEHVGETASNVVFGRVVGLHIQDQFLDDAGRFDTVRARPLTRLGGIQYASPGPVIEMQQPFKRAAEIRSPIS